MNNLFEDQAQQDIANARGSTSTAIMPTGASFINYPPPDGSAPRQRPTDKEFIAKVSADYGLTHRQACDLIMEIADRMRVSP